MSFSPSKPSQNVVPLRTFDPKYSHYFSDGSGRDNFVMYNNGGFSIPRIYNPMQGTNYMKLGKSQNNNNGSGVNMYGTTSSSNTSPRREPMTVEYRSDGTGRDSYIVCNSGGLKQIFNKTHCEQFFKNSLRQSERRMYRSGGRRG